MTNRPQDETRAGLPAGPDRADKPTELTYPLLRAPVCHRPGHGPWECELMRNLLWRCPECGTYVATTDEERAYVREVDDAAEARRLRALEALGILAAGDASIRGSK